MAPEKIQGWRRSTDFSRPGLRMMEGMSLSYCKLQSQAMPGPGRTYNDIMAARLRIRSPLLPLVTAAMLVAQVVDPSPIWKGLLTAFAGLWLVSYLWARSLQRKLRLERLMRYGWAQVGDRLEEQFVVRNDGWLPATWLDVRDGSTLPGYSVAQATGVDGWGQNVWRTSGTCARRGIFELGHTRLVTGDPLGIYRVELEYPEVVTLTVMPPVIPLPFVESSAGGWQGEGRPRPHAAEETLHAETVRSYAPGDSLRLIHWPTTARRLEPYVRILEGAPASDWWIVLDCEQRVQAAADEAESTTELGVILAASLAERGLRMHRSVGFVAGSEPPTWIKPEPGERQRWEILRALAQLDPGPTSLALLLESAASSLGRRANLIVVTPSTETGWVDALTRLAWRGMVPTALLIDPATFGAGISVTPIAQLLSEAGIAHDIVGRELFRRPEARPGPTGQWDWRTLPTGKAIPIRRPSDMSWRDLR
jgi:uncharacterized protein (DUF58 family)